MRAYILLDRSGSMADKWTEALSAINGYVTELAQASPALAVTLATFDNPEHGAPAQREIFGEVPWFEVIRDSVRADGWQAVTSQDAAPRGATPLFDAIERLLSLAESAETDRAVIVVMTDGHENASTVATKISARTRLDRCRESGWQVVFLGADFDAMRQAKDLGAHAAQALNLRAGRYSAAMDVVARSTVAYAVSGTAMSFIDADRQTTQAEIEPSRLQRPRRRS
jgi:hypothetical protein